MAQEVIKLLRQKVHEMLRILHMPDITDRVMHTLTIRVGQTSKSALTGVRFSVSPLLHKVTAEIPANLIREAA